MKNKKTNVLKRRSLLAIALITVIGFSFVACGSNGDPSSPGGNGAPTSQPGGNPSVTNVTVTPGTAIISTGQTQQFNASVTGTNNPAQTVTWTVTGGGSGTGISQSGLLTVAVNETAATLTVKAVSTVDMSKSGAAAVTVTKPVLWSVNDLTTWGDMVNGIRNSGNNKAHIITLSGNISALATPSSGNTFGDVTGITVLIEGSGTISVSGNGSLLRIGAGQTVTVRNITLQGRDGNDSSVVRIEGGIFRMAGNASVTGNVNSSIFGGGGGVYVTSDYIIETRTLYTGTFIMQDNASVTGNTSGNNGGGVYVNGSSSMEGTTFIMQDRATVSGNTGKDKGGGVYFNGGTFTIKDNAAVKDNTIDGGSYGDADGGGVYIDNGTFIIDGGTISGNTAGGGISGGAFGAGVYTTSNGTLIIKSGTISNNTAQGKPIAWGGGVFGEMNTITMEGGTITNNTAIAANDSSNSTVEARGGGVNGTLIMKGGTISGNTVSAAKASGSIAGSIVYASGGGIYGGGITMEGGIISGNTISASNAVNSGNVNVKGGGVWTSSFTKTGGTIYGNDAADGLRNIANNGKGHAVYDLSIDSWRNTTAGPSMNTDIYGFWLNE